MPVAEAEIASRRAAFRHYLFLGLTVPSVHTCKHSSGFTEHPPGITADTLAAKYSFFS